MSRNKFVRIIVTAAVMIMMMCQFACQKNDLQGRIDFYIDLANGNVTSTDGSYQNQINDYQNLTVTGGYVYVNGLVVFKGVDGYYYALSQYCTSDNCNLEYQVSYDRLYCPCDGSLYNTDGSVLMGPAVVQLYRYAAVISGTLLHVYTP
ncbi:MAG TPA: Rieske (2Fe-2S) protein [Chitinophagales bacterium]|nr:Rieske (2Fe-2S) protein [Chitinophagales bacterium]